MNSAKKIATIVGSDKGGVGKTLVSSLLIEAYDQAQRPLSVIEIDHQGKLSSLMGERVDLRMGAGASLDDISINKHRAERFYNPAYEKMAQQDSLTDLGANVTTFLFNWMEQCSIAELALEDGVHFRFIAVTTPDDQALKSAYHAICNAVSALGNEAEYFLLMNETAPGTGFGHYRNHQVYNDLMALPERIGLTVIEIPHCDSELMEYGRSRALTPLAIFTNRDRLVDEMDLQRVAANTEKRRLLRWMTTVQESLRPLFSAAGRRPAEPAPRAEPAYRQPVQAQDRSVDRQPLDRQPLDRQSLDRQSLDRQVPERQVPERQAADRMPERHQAPERIAAERAPRYEPVVVERDQRVMPRSEVRLADRIAPLHAHAADGREFGAPRRDYRDDQRSDFHGGHADRRETPFVAAREMADPLLRALDTEVVPRGRTEHR